MLKRRLLVSALSLIMAFSPVLDPIAAYAETQQEQQLAVTLTQDGQMADENAATDSQDGTSPSQEGDQSPETPISEDDSISDVVSSDGGQHSDVEELEYVYADKKVVSLGETQNIVIGFASDAGRVTSAKILIRDSKGGEVELQSANVQDNAALFSQGYENENEVCEYRIVSVSYWVEGLDEEQSIDLSSDESNSDGYGYEVVTPEVAQSFDGGSDEGVTAMYADADGNYHAADSVGDAISAVEASSSSDDGIATYSVNSSSREDYLIVAIDPGHGGADGGAEANGLKESDINWSIANHLKDELMTYTGVTPYLVRYNSGDNPSLQERVDRAASIHADVFVSVHINSADAESARGFEIWVPNASSYNYEAHVVGEQLASKIESQLAGLGLYDRGIKTRDYPTGGSSSHYADGSASDYYGVIRDARKAGIPGIIVEHAFITNSADASKLASDSFRNQLGVSDATGIAQQYGLGKDSETRASASVAVTAHIAGLGWENAVYDGKIAGTTGKSVNLEAFKLSVLNDVATSGGISYRANVEGSWQGWKGSGEVAGTTGQSKAVEAVQIKLTGDAANKYDIYYRVHSAEIGWLDWAKNGESAGTNGYGYGAQALEVVIVNKSAAAPGSTARPYLQKGNVPASIECRGHVSDVGWQAWAAGSAGTTGQSRRLEALQLRVAGFSGSGDVECQAHVQDYGWMGWQGSGSYAGTTGQSKRVEAVRIRLTGELAEKYDVWYRVHSQEFGWLGWASDGASAGTQGYGYRAEAVEVRLLPKGSAAPGTTDGAFHEKPASIECRGHVSDVGWQAWAAGSAGTTGQSRRLEALQLRVAGFSGSGDVECQAHVQDYGWMGWQGSGSYAGTTGQSKRVEAVRIRLTGELAEKYDVWYRVHSQEFGWLGWASDGASAGTQGYGYRAEAVEVRLLPKGSAAPGTTDGAFRNKDVQQSQDQVESEPIMGNATKPAEQMAATYMRTGHVYPSSTYAAKGAPTIQDFCSIVESEAKAEGVRPEVVFAQAMLETGWLQFGGSVKAEQCNFAGIGALNATVGGASFPDVATGIRAQVQHLKAYASTDPLKKARVDPRFSYVERGCAPYVTDLNGRWAVPGTNYGQSIISVMNAI